MNPPPLPDGSQPQNILARWLPHVLLIILVLVSLALVGILLAPLRDPIFLAVALAALTAPLCFEPWNRLAQRLLPKVPDMLRRQMAGIMATLCIVVIVATPVVALILTTVGSPQQAVDVIIGISLRDGERMAPLFAAVERQIEGLNRLYPNLPLEPSKVSAWLSEALTEASDFGPTILGFLFRGTGSLIAQLSLALIILPNCYAQGGVAARFLLGYTPLNETQMKQFAQRYHSVVLRLLSDTVLFAVLHGILLGTLAWLFLGLPLVPLILLAAFLSLVPAVGTTMVWLPLVLVQWTSGQVLAAIALGILSIGGSWLLSYARQRIGRRLDEAAGTWLAFMLFLGLVGGLLSFGAQGFIIGPMIMVLAVLVIAHLLPYYGLGHVDEETGIDTDSTGSSEIGLR